MLYVQEHYDKRRNSRSWSVMRCGNTQDEEITRVYREDLAYSIKQEEDRKEELREGKDTKRKWI